MMKQYEVEIKGKYSHGIYGKEHYFGMVLSAENCKSAESFAEDILYDMTYQEFFERCFDNCFRTDLAKKQFMHVKEWKKTKMGQLIFRFISEILLTK